MPEFTLDPTRDPLEQMVDKVLEMPSIRAAVKPEAMGEFTALMRRELKGVPFTAEGYVSAVARRLNDPAYSGFRVPQPAKVDAPAPGSLESISSAWKAANLSGSMGLHPGSTAAPMAAFPQPDPPGSLEDMLRSRVNIAGSGFGLTGTRPAAKK